MKQQSSIPSSQQTELHSPSSIPHIEGSDGVAAMALQNHFNPLTRVVFVNKVLLFTVPHLRNAFELSAVNATWADTIHNYTVKNHSKFGFNVNNLLNAVAMGRESRVVNVDRQPREIFAADILRRCPHWLLEKGTLTDWGGRTFQEITAFQYALWAKDFKMIEMMLKSIPPEEEADYIRFELLRQYERMTLEREQGGGLTYTHTYERPKLDAAGIPMKSALGNWESETVTEERWDNHFDLTPLLNAYHHFNAHFNYKNFYDDLITPQRQACWLKLIGTQQRLLPIHILQRYCVLNVPFYPIPSFTGVFERTTQYFDHLSRKSESLLSPQLSNDYSLFRGVRSREAQKVSDSTGAPYDLQALQYLNQVSTREIENIVKLQLMRAGQSQAPIQKRP